MGCRTTAPAQVTSVKNNDDVTFYPNPANSTLNIVASEDVNVAILSMDGKTLISLNNAKSINVNALASGLYMIKVYDTKDALIKTTKFTKE
jgi:NAD kinase